MTTSYADRFVAEGNVQPAGFVQLTNLSSAVGIGTGAGRAALIQCLNQHVRWRDDGTAPTTSVGMRIHAGETFLYLGDPRAIQFIEETAGAELNISMYE